MPGTVETEAGGTRTATGTPAVPPRSPASELGTSPGTTIAVRFAGFVQSSKKLIVPQPVSKMLSTPIVAVVAPVETALTTVVT